MAKTKVSSGDAFAAAAAEWIAGQGGRTLDRLARANLERFAASFRWAAGAAPAGVNAAPAGALACAAKDGAALVLVAVAGVDSADDAAALEACDAALSLRVSLGGDEIFCCDARATGATPKWASMQIRANCDQAALERLRLAALPAVDDLTDVLAFLMALPWLPAGPLRGPVQSALLEDLLVDLCEDEGEDDVDFCNDMDGDDDGAAPAAKRRAKNDDDDDEDD
ncbi:hypothetical protein M885DRAFT_626336 [Pelagophyceae sp. CCMP2097]|nr:hypothetical protein M885DRAFT_626336 [Pelagophyceae sp. CCMP2097]